MPIPSESTEIITTTTTAVPATQVYVDVEEMHVGRPKVRGGTPSLTIIATEYTEAEDGTRIYAAASEEIKTLDLFGLGAVCPEAAFAVMAIFAAVPAVRRLKKLNAEKLAAERIAAAERLNTANAAEQAAAAALAATVAPRNAAFEAKELLEDADPGKAAAVAAWNAADAAWQAAGSAHNNAIANVAAVAASNAARLKIAEAAVTDPANPPLA